MYERMHGDRFHVRTLTVTELADGYKAPLPQANKKHEGFCEPRGGDWYGGIRNRADAETLLTRGWAEGARKALALKEDLGAELPKAKSVRRRQKWGDNGDSLHIDRALRGDWDQAWRTTYREMRSGTRVHVTLVAGWGGNCGMTAEQLFWSGAAMLVISDMLESAGYSTRIDAVVKTESAPNPGYINLNVITIKDHGDPMVTDALAGVVCHAGVFRSFGFRAICNAPWDTGGGSARSVDWDEVDHYGAKAGWEVEPNTVRVRDCYDRNAALAEVKRVLAILQPE